MGITGYCLGQLFIFLDLLPHGVIWMAEMYPTILCQWSCTGLATLHTSANNSLFSTFAIRTVCVCCFDSKSIRAFCCKRRGLTWSFHSKREKIERKEKLVISHQKIGCMWHIKLLFNHVMYAIAVRLIDKGTTQNSAYHMIMYIYPIDVFYTSKMSFKDKSLHGHLKTWNFLAKISCFKCFHLEFDNVFSFIAFTYVTISGINFTWIPFLFWFLPSPWVLLFKYQWLQLKLNCKSWLWIFETSFWSNEIS